MEETRRGAAGAAFFAALARLGAALTGVFFLELAGLATTFFFETFFEADFFFEAGFFGAAAFFLAAPFFDGAFFEVLFLLDAAAAFPVFFAERLVTFFRLTTAERLAVVFREVFLAVFLVLPGFFFFLAAAFLAGI